MIPRSPADEWVAGRLGISAHELSSERLAEWQTAEFVKAAEYARAHSRYYAESLYGKELRDISSLPFTSEAELAGNEWRFQCVSPAEVARVVTVPTTGTVGMKKRLSFSETDQRRAVDFIRTGFMTMCSPGERMLIMMSGNAPGSIGELVCRAMEPMGIECVTVGAVSDIVEFYEKLVRFRPQTLVGIPCQLAALASFGRRFGNPEREFIASVLLSADDVPEAVCERLERLWQCDCFRHYGMTEMCIAGGVECRGHNGYHLRACDLLFEIADADESGFGEIVITTLGREAMPLIRYRTGDIGKLVYNKCPCGSSLPRLLTVKGRKRNMVTVGGKRIFLSDIAEAVFRDDSAVDFSCALAEDGSLMLTAFTLPGETVDAEAIRYRLGVPASVTCETRTAFPTDSGLKKRIEIL